MNHQPSEPTPKIGLLLPTFDPFRDGGPRPVIEFARRAEALGFDGVWAGDHLICPAPVIDAVTSAAACAAVTERITIGFAVMLLGLRPLIWTAKQLVTLQQLSGDRVELGVGVGGEFPVEYEAAGVPHERRGRRLDEALAALPGLVTGETGELEPAAKMPRLLVGGRSDAAMRRAARTAEVWLPMWVSAKTLAERSAQLHEAAAGFDRPTPKQGLLMLASPGAEMADCREQADLHLRGQYRMGLDRVERWTGLGEPERIAEFLNSYIEIGVEEFVLMALGRDPLRQLEKLGEVLSFLPSHAGRTSAEKEPS